MTFDKERFQRLDYTNAKVTDCYGYSDNFVICGDFAVGDIPHFILTFAKISDKPDTLRKEDIVGDRITAIDVSEGDPLRVLLSFGSGITAEFTCNRLSQTLEMYKGKSYKNVYPDWQNYMSSSAYVECEKYLEEEESDRIGEYDIKIKRYCEISSGVMRGSLQCFEFSLNGEPVYAWKSTSYSNPHDYFDIIHHKNGHRYFPFHIDLYGLSVLDLDTREVFHYIPEGYNHDISQYCGESFIITDVHYDAQTNMIAYGGCYWAGPNDVMTGDFSDPLNFDPHLVDLHELIDLDWEKFDDIDFARFEDGKLIVSADRKEEFSFGVDELFAKIKALA